ncbi:MAG TPA: hypothetical protein VKR61_20435 [Bryobacteraceae bacterium]|nr:hypothetical protein [Bryobacteraceae bacterium]
MSLAERITNISARAGFTIVPLAIAFCLVPAVQAQPSDPLTVALKAHPDWVQVPGALIRPDCVHEIPNGAQVEENGDITLEGSIVAHYDACSEAPIRTRPLHQVAPQFGDAPGTGNGWVEAVQEEVSLGSGDNIDKISGTWTVPNTPTDNGGLIYIFNALEPTTENLIIQPVLQYGATSAGGNIGGNYWVIASWMVGSSALHSPGERVNPGDTISGNTYVTSVSSGKTNWIIKSKDTITGAWSNLKVWTSGYTWNWAFAGVLEAYNITTCLDFPSSGETQFKNTKVYHGYPAFTSVPSTFFGAVYSYGGPSCGFSPVSGSTDTLHY